MVTRACNGSHFVQKFILSQTVLDEIEENCWSFVVVTLEFFMKKGTH